MWKLVFIVSIESAFVKLQEELDIMLSLWGFLIVVCVESLSPQCDEGICSLICPGHRPRVCMNGQQCKRDSDCRKFGYHGQYKITTLMYLMQVLLEITTQINR